MELKDLILSTIGEFDKEIKNTQIKEQDDEVRFLNHFKERLATLFVSLQAPNNKKFETKLNLTLDYLEHSLKSIDDRLKQISDKNAK